MNSNKVNKLKTAMILAAGFGTRLKPLTDTVPKALVPYKGKPMIYNVITRLVDAGITNITVNTHYLSGQVEEYFSKNDFGIEINLIHEEEILGTGGAIKNAERFLAASENFLVHNADVDSDINIREMFEFHTAQSPLATLAVMKRVTSRPLLVDSNHELAGRIIDSEDKLFKSVKNLELHKTAFSGIHILSNEIFKHFPTEAAFDIMPVYMNMVSKNKKIVCFETDNAFWRDIGKPGNL